MLVLSIDTATKACAVGLCRDGKILAEYKINMGMTHSEGLMPQLEQLLERTGVQKADIDLIGRSAGLRMEKAFAGRSNTACLSL